MNEDVQYYGYDSRPYVQFETDVLRREVENIEAALISWWEGWSSDDSLWAAIDRFEPYGHGTLAELSSPSANIRRQAAKLVRRCRAAESAKCSFAFALSKLEKARLLGGDDPTFARRRVITDLSKRLPTEAASFRPFLDIST